MPNPADALVAAFATNNRINVYLIRNLADEAWRLKGPGGKGRDAASMLAHMHNVRLMWLKSAGKTAAMPEKLDGESCSKEEAIQAFEESGAAVEALLRDAMNGDGRVKGFKPDVYSFLGYLIAHEGHHRGQVSMLARQVGYPLSKSVMFGMWEWGTR
jgi:uncharacterized damage-inducible protein DinB